CLSIFASTAAFSADGKPVAKIVKIKGEVHVLDKNHRVVASAEGKPNRRVLSEGSPSFEKETLQTKDSGRVKIQFDKDGNEVVLGGGSSLVIQEGGGKGAIALELKSGSVRSNVNGKYDSEKGYQVKTPNAVAG